MRNLPIISTVVSLVALIIALTALIISKPSCCPPERFYHDIRKEEKTINFKFNKDKVKDNSMVIKIKDDFYEMFNIIDKDSNGILSKQEWNFYYKKMNDNNKKHPDFRKKEKDLNSVGSLSLEK